MAAEQNIDAERAAFEFEHCGNNKQIVRRNEQGDYVLPSVQDAWAGWQSCARRSASPDLLEALQIADRFCGSLTSDVCPDAVHIPIRAAIAAWNRRSAAIGVGGLLEPTVKVPQVVLDALDIAYDLAVAEADHVHEVYKGYNPKCKGSTGPRGLVERRALEQQVADQRARAQAAQGVKTWQERMPDRSLFEISGVTRNLRRDQCCPDVYEDSHTQIAWDGFQAGLRAQLARHSQGGQNMISRWLELIRVWIADPMRSDYVSVNKKYLRDMASDFEFFIDAQPSGKVQGEPVAWIRFCSDGGYEGPIMHTAIEEVRKKSGAWTPLYAAPPLSSEQQAQPESAGQAQNCRSTEKVQAMQAEKGENDVG